MWCEADGLGFAIANVDKSRWWLGDVVGWWIWIFGEGLHRGDEINGTGKYLQQLLHGAHNFLNFFFFF